MSEQMKRKAHKTQLHVQMLHKHTRKVLEVVTPNSKKFPLVRRMDLRRGPMETFTFPVFDFFNKKSIFVFYFCE